MSMSATRTSSAPRSKDLQVESLRGLAVILMVMGHVIGPGPSRGMQVATDSAWHFGFTVLLDFRMPLFTVLSGFVYGYRPLQSFAGFGSLVKGKFQRLLVPLICVGTIYYLVQAFTPAANLRPDPADIWRVYVFGHDHLWFLQAVFLIFIVVGALDASGVLSNKRNFLAALIAASVGFLFHNIQDSIDVFSFGGFLRLLPFFLVGYGLNKFKPHFSKVLVILICSAGFFLLAMHVLQLVELVPAPQSWPWPMAQSFLVGLFSCTSVFLLRKYIHFSALAWIGKFSFSIYLLHVFGSAPVRIALKKAGVEDNLLIFTACMLAAIGLPIAFELVFGRITLVSRMFLGQKPRTKPAVPNVSIAPPR